MATRSRRPQVQTEDTSEESTSATQEDGVISPSPKGASQNGNFAGGPHTNQPTDSPPAQNTPATNARAAAFKGASASKPEGKIALVLAGGGITGAVYEVGALRAMDDMLTGRSVNDFDIYVGTSAGALVNAFLANGLTPGQSMHLINDRHPEIRGFQVSDIFRLNLEEGVQRAAMLPGILWSVCSNVIKNRGNVAPADLMWEVAQVLPAGLYDGNALERFIRATLEKHPAQNSFRQMERDLFIVATELDSGARAVFGRGHIEDVPISQAVAASSAVPVLYRPVQIYEKDYMDGMLHGAASLDLAIEAGAKLVVCINPMVPFNASEIRPHEHYIRNRGMQAVINQSVRTLMHSSLRYHIKNLRMKHPDVDIILIQPSLDDHEMFSRSPMDFAGRLAVAQHGFESVSMGLLRNQHYYGSVLARHGLRMYTDLVCAELDALEHSGNDQRVMQQVIGVGEDEGTLPRSLALLEFRLRQLGQFVDEAEYKQTSPAEVMY